MDDRSATTKEAQEEVDRAWTAEQRRKNTAEAKAEQLSNEDIPKSAPVVHAHAQRVDDADREVAEELAWRHNNQVSVGFSKMTEESMAESKSKKVATKSAEVKK